jgi:hypothetical protein
MGTNRGRTENEIRNEGSRPMKTVIKTNAADEAKSAVEEARSAIGGARKTVGKTARRTYLRGRIAAARATASRRTTTSKKGIAAAGAAGAAGAYFLDPQEGNRRRKLAVNRVTALFRKARPENDAASDQQPPREPARSTA